MVIELAVHYYDLWEHLLDTRLQHVTAMSRSAEGDDMTAFVAGRTASGIIVSAEFSSKATEQHEIEVYGDRARARASLYPTPQPRTWRPWARSWVLRSR